MTGCSNPVQCQTAKRVECTCACGGSNHAVLRKLLDSTDVDTKAQGVERLKELKEAQVAIKKTKKAERRQKRAESRKSQK